MREDYEVCHDLNGTCPAAGVHGWAFASIRDGLFPFDGGLKAAHSIEDVLTKLRQGLPVAKDQWL